MSASFTDDFQQFEVSCQSSFDTERKEKFLRPSDLLALLMFRYNVRHTHCNGV